MSEKISVVYHELYDAYGPQGWWPLVEHDGTNPTKTGAISGYHVGDYTFPRTKKEQFEICLGCFLTQNTAWTSVERSLLNLKKLHALSPQRIMEMDDKIFTEAIKPSGYHNQKSRYIKKFIPFFLALDEHVPTRTELLELLGVGPETADSMLLYAFKQPEFVVDTYTKRIFIQVGLIREKTSYDIVKSMCEVALKNEILDQDRLIVAYQEFHALLVEHAKRHYSKKPYGENCFLQMFDDK